MLVEFWRDSYRALSLLTTWRTDVPRREDKAAAVWPQCPSMVGVILLTTVSRFVFPVTFTVSGLAGSMVTVQVVKETFREKEEIPPNAVCTVSDGKVPSPTLRMPQQHCD